MPQINTTDSFSSGQKASEDQGRKNEDYILDLIFGNECSNCANKEKSNYVKAIIVSLVIALIVVLIVYLALVNFMGDTLSPGQIYLILGGVFLVVMLISLFLLRPKPQNKDENK